MYTTLLQKYFSQNLFGIILRKLYIDFPIFIWNPLIELHCDVFLSQTAIITVNVLFMISNGEERGHNHSLISDSFTQIYLFCLDCHWCIFLEQNKFI